jgi:two-component sensor histidine kinase
MTGPTRRPATTPPKEDGFGMRFIRESAKHDLHGTSQCEFLADGLRCRLELPAGSVIWDPSSGKLSKS